MVRGPLQSNGLNQDSGIFRMFPNSAYLRNPEIKRITVQTTVFTIILSGGKPRETSGGNCDSMVCTACCIEPARNVCQPHTP